MTMSPAERIRALAEQLDNFIQEHEESVFIEAEGKPDALHAFLSDYNRHHEPTIDETTDGIIELEEDANKWGLEIRLYLNHRPDFIDTARNMVYRPEYTYRINANKVLRELFNRGYRIGQNDIV